MAFFLIVPSIMIVSVLLVHALANRLGLRIYYTTLFAVAMLSFMVIFATTFVTPSIGREFLMRLGLMISVAATFLTFANKFLLNKQLAEEKRFDEEVKAAYEEEKRKSSIFKDEKTNEFDWGDERASLAAKNFLHEEPSTTKYNKLDIEEPATTTDNNIDIEEPATATDNEIDIEEPSTATDNEIDVEEPLTIADNDINVEEPSTATDNDIDIEEPLTAAANNIDVEEPSTVADNDVDIEEPSTVADNDVDIEEPSTVADNDIDVEEPSTVADNDIDVEEPSTAADNDVDIEEPLTATDNDVDVEEPSTANDDELNDDNLDPVEDFPLEKVFEPLPEIKSEDADKPIKLEEKPEPKEDFPLEEVFKPLPIVKPEEIEKQTEQQQTEPVEKKVKRTEFFPLQEVFRPLSTLKIDKLEEYAQDEKNSPHEDEPNSIDNDTLDDILDKAYNERDKGHVWQAIELYKKALERYRNDEYAPFVAIDLGNLYKEEALYSKAIKIYEEALRLPAVKRNATIKKEFASNLKYLRVVREVLLKNHMLSMPFDKLSKEILQEIDTEFKKVQINSTQSK